MPMLKEDIIYLSESLGDVDQILRDGLDRHTKDKVDIKTTPHNVLLKMNHDVKGGLKGYIAGDSLYIKLLWIADDMRGQSFGRKLLVKAEDEARKLGVKKSFVDTAAYQAPDFYRSCGYQDIATVSGFYNGHDRIFLCKDLS